MRNRVYLSAEQRVLLEQLIRKGQGRAREQTRARILLLADRSQGQQRTQEEVAQATLTSTFTVAAISRRFAQEGLEAALKEKPRPGAKPKITGEVEAHLTLLACSCPPEGQAAWTLQLLADKLVELQLVESISHTAIGQRLKKTTLSRGAFNRGAWPSLVRSS